MTHRVLLLLAVTSVCGCERAGLDEDVSRVDTVTTEPELHSAARRYRQALELDPDRADTHLELAHVLEELGDYAAAANHCDTALALDQTDPRAWHLRGRLSERAGDDDAAVAAYAATLERAPHASQPRELLAGALMRLGRYDAARQHYVQRLSHDDTAPARVLYGYGLALIASGRCAAALDPLRRAYAAEPSGAATAEALIRVQSSCAAGDASAQALPLAAELFRARPEAAVAEALAMAHAARGEFDNAVLLQRRVVASGQLGPYSLELLGHFERGEPAPAPFGPGAGAFQVPRLGGR